MLRYKFDAIIKIMQLRALIEKETGKMIKQVQIDNNMEFCSKLLNEFCMKEGIVKRCTTVNEPQHIAELLSRTLLEMAHKMISSAGMARRFLADALNTASYLIIRSPSTTIKHQTPKEVWSGNVTNYSILRIFGCPYYVRASDDKLDGRAR